MDKMLMQGKVAMVTGGGRGIGEASARRLADFGAKVILADLDLASATAVAESLKNEGKEAAAIEFNVADFAHITEKVAAARAIYGRIDVLVNVAGITGSTPITDITHESWDRMMDIDLKSLFFVSQAVFEVMKEQGYGKMVHMSSGGAARRQKLRRVLCLRQGWHPEPEQVLRSGGRAVPHHVQRRLPRQYPDPDGQDPLLVEEGPQDLYPRRPLRHRRGYRERRAVLCQRPV